MANAKIRLTRDALAKLQEELTWIKNVREGEVAAQLAEARSFGDLSENSEYDAAKDEQGKVHARMQELEYILDNNYELVDESSTDTETVHLGCTVTVLDVEFEEEQTFTLVVSQEADISAGKISEESPFGKALLHHEPRLDENGEVMRDEHGAVMMAGAKVGEEVTVEAPAGPVVFRVMSVQ